MADPKACQCGEVLKGVIKPWECKVFGTACTPETPIGTCMVSSEGACAAYYNFGRLHRDVVVGLGRRRKAPLGLLGGLLSRFGARTMYRSCALVLRRDQFARVRPIRPLAAVR